jgi:glucokinase
MTIGLIADIGATNARFALVEGGEIRDLTSLACQQYASFTDALSNYLTQTGRRADVSCGVVAIAGPVTGDQVALTNHPWSFSVKAVTDMFRMNLFHVMNDFEAVARGIPSLTDNDVVKIGEGTPQPGKPKAVIGPGTGLGVAGLFWDGQKYIPNPCEGGHVTFPARTAREFELIRILQDQHTHVSAERVCSGMGLVNIYETLKKIEDKTHLPVLTAEEISTKARDQSCALCQESLTLMLTFLGRIAGNLALTLNAQGGIYIAGGIPAKLGDDFITSPFRGEFINKGRQRDYVNAMPTYLITHPHIAMVGLQAYVQKIMSRA